SLRGASCSCAIAGAAAMKARLRASADVPAKAHLWRIITSRLHHMPGGTRACFVRTKTRQDAYATVMRFGVPHCKGACKLPCQEPSCPYILPRQAMRLAHMGVC